MEIKYPVAVIYNQKDYPQCIESKSCIIYNNDKTLNVLLKAPPDKSSRFAEESLEELHDWANKYNHILLYE